ncbi:cation diffusion facilitator family transporter [Pseudoalteromonas tunicata]|jgi:cobalt-zinc-cadmium efflux system protein|uniref:Putative CzcD, Co/Zn/Cd efflux system component protein n=1 Tax=Pseudoalteromonas tunicata D2 TaxID=87626 RepID=A4C4Q3_9GAMM|nr:cation diffusion facilitator family transporter [Pseudoalteromonas tunicata]ATC96986.1 hypothetical protein PTUN_b0634 [Pseudoalteromonas tunicata]AXT33107.1 cation transporter [Pseudoalteromonas tunicata]EAR30535.1 putative CzcD, Co/Zn/Cd efflux system component protein [Pseudoalteromonas tunicata D2]MDP4982128.1 cation diffusion facilitator family transporter [Pseudoalteromonas tunicata]MDP5213893.1 cation diffusion facilitator family transporter [Pseudoalteromonas tunicata]
MTDITTHKSSRRRLLIALSITCTFMIIQVFAAYFANSLAVLADAGHLFIHNSSLFIAILASTLAIKLATTYNDGYRKAELGGGLINGLLYLIISSYILFKGGERFFEHHHGEELAINTFLMSSVAAIGFLFHAAAAFVLYKGRKDSINVYAVFLHTFFDLLSTVSTFVASMVIHFTGWVVVDLISSMLITVFVLFTGIRLLYQCVRGLFFYKPRLPSLKSIEKALLSIEHIENIHNLTIKADDENWVVGAHIVLKHSCTLEKHDEVCRFEVEKILKKQFNINQCVLQVEAGICHHQKSTPKLN